MASAVANRSKTATASSSRGSAPQSGAWPKAIIPPASTRLWSRKCTQAAPTAAITSASRGNHTLVTSWAFITIDDVPALSAALNRFQARSPARKKIPK